MPNWLFEIPRKISFLDDVDQSMSITKVYKRLGKAKKWEKIKCSMEELILSFQNEQWNFAEGPIVAQLIKHKNLCANEIKNKLSRENYI